MSAEPLRLHREPRDGEYVAMVRGLVALGAARAVFSHPRRHTSELELARFEDRSGRAARHHALVSRSRRAVAYDLEPALIEILLTRVDRLYGWLGPRPEDLALERRDRTPMLVTIAHDERGWLELTPDERACLREHWPALEDHLAKVRIRTGRRR